MRGYMHMCTCTWVPIYIAKTELFLNKYLYYVSCNHVHMSLLCATLPCHVATAQPDICEVVVCILEYHFTLSCNLYDKGLS